ncbi:translation initiation factor IF-2 [Aerococcus urinaehominis]|uniref:Translation initiation factor IF-2 n=1 Tax=Aerococcus urinaehominis TaxID=128944 RepID=A0A0X8FK74_9LACT|nr:translation initiation factor IF-2 [Aerococcus urinaehominis]AMB98819.1 translation initiation factor IF-2 [Aerococcus urinaehominis]SDM49002.1 translation initiation factor IF-2 [Aerococcus urinaehominis]
MSKKRVYQLAKELDVSSKDLLTRAKEIGLDYSSHMASVESEDEERLAKAVTNPSKADKKQAEKTSNNKQVTSHNQHKKSEKKQTNGHHKVTSKKAQRSDSAQATVEEAEERQNERDRQHGRGQGRNQQNAQNRRNNKKKNRRNNQQKNNNNQPNYNKRKPVKHQPNAPKQKETPDKVEYEVGMTVADLAKKIHKEPAEVIKKLFMMGVMANQNQSLDADAIELVLAEYGIEAEEKVIIDPTDFDHYFEEAAHEAADKLSGRPAVVTIMGHVDHGKTTLLDYLRQANVTEGEAGGITQHIGAYQVDANGQEVTFVDTPGHAAFTTMRARGADITDIVIIVVAADDGVMPQTVEAINHAKAAEVPIIVAVNKIDKPTANPDRVMQELTEYGLIAEAWGGDTIFVNISAKFGQNVDELLDMILLVAEVEELKANPDRLALGSVVEARLDPHRGAVATLLVQEGTLKIGDPLVVGDTYGRVRAMTNDHGRRIKEAGPSTPVEITGLNDSPEAGDRFVVFEDEKTARQIGEQRASQAQQRRRNQTHKVTLDNLFETIQEGQMKTVNVIIKADVQGSAEALASSLQKIDVEGVRVDIVHNAVGAINESDVTLAAASNAIIIGFNVRPTPTAKEQASEEGVEIRLHNVIYAAIDEIETAMKGMLDPEYEEQVTGSVVVRETYKVSKVGTIAGAYVSEGVIRRNSKVRVIRDNIVVYEGELASLKRFKDDAREVSKGYECGIMIEGYNDIKVDDVIEPYEMVEIERK